ncbi:MAG: hypothetical protein K9I94_10495 [Bacteroidales bacterium]|nr:hypothetical protein [Bacteroidales bacterium]
MRKQLIILLVGLFISTLAAGQSQPDTITYEKAGGSYQFKHRGSVLTPAQLKGKMRGYPQAYDYMQKAKTNADVANVFAYAGGFLIGYQLGSLIGGGEFNAAVAGAGGRLILVAIPLVSGYNKNALKAVKIYNQKLSEQAPGDEASMDGLQIHFGQTNHGVGVRVSF